MENWIDSQVAFSGRVFSVRTGTVCLDDGSNARRDVVEHGGGVAIVPIMDDSVVLIRQFRVSIGREIIEIPAGRLEANESPESCADREIQEELGCRAERLVLAHSYYSSVGFTNERMFVYLGFDLVEAERHLEWDERIQIIRLPISEVEVKLTRGDFEDSKTIVGLYALLSYLKKKDSTRLKTPVLT
jgi:ADP-ribose pyrophosphatase